jgi:hypothetical protein
VDPLDSTFISLPPAVTGSKSQKSRPESPDEPPGPHSYSHAQRVDLLAVLGTRPLHG